MTLCKEKICLDCNKCVNDIFFLISSSIGTYYTFNSSKYMEKYRLKYINCNDNNYEEC